MESEGGSGTSMSFSAGAVGVVAVAAVPKNDMGIVSSGGGSSRPNSFSRHYHYHDACSRLSSARPTTRRPHRDTTMLRALHPPRPASSALARCSWKEGDVVAAIVGGMGRQFDGPSSSQVDTPSSRWCRMLRYRLPFVCLLA